MLASNITHYLKKIVIHGCAFSCAALAINQAHAETLSKFSRPYYVGVTSGYGRTTWQGLVPPDNKQNPAMALSTPRYVSEGGAIWGIFGGYEFLPYFALEAAYTRYPNAKITFDPDSIFTFEHNGTSSFITKTETVSLLAKIMMIIPHSDIRAYSGMGLSEVHRSDEISDKWMSRPTFGVGFNYNFSEHIMTEIGGSYTAGQGQSELNPVQNYFPFLYSVFLRLAYRF